VKLEPAQKETKMNEKQPLLDPCGNIVSDDARVPGFVEAHERAHATHQNSAQEDGEYINTRSGRVVPTQVVRAFSKPSIEFDFLSEDYVSGFYPTLELTSGVEVRVGEFCFSFVESEGVLTNVLEEVRRKSASY
jgi:hypothetical protein